jgi:2-oxoisovalerate dehydrogenase E1 component alpha subunit
MSSSPEQPHGTLPRSDSAITSQLTFLNSVMPDGEKIPTYRVLDGAGRVLEGATLPEVCSRLQLVFHNKG